MIGQFATSKAGHDKNMLYVVVAEEGEFVALCDGQRKNRQFVPNRTVDHVDAAPGASPILTFHEPFSR